MLIKIISITTSSLMQQVRYNVMLSEDENTYANDEWSRLLPDIRHNATVDLDAVFGEFQLINPRAKSFLCGIQAAFITSGSQQDRAYICHGFR